MGIRLEPLLSVMIAVVISGSLLIKLSSTLKNDRAFSKDLEFTNTTFIEVDTNKTQWWLFGTYGAFDKEVLTVDNIVFHADTIDSLSAIRGRYFNDVLYLDGNVVLQSQDGYRYETQHANYNQKTKQLHITTLFTAARGQNMMKGETLRYDTQSKEAFGTGVDAVIYTTEK